MIRLDINGPHVQIESDGTNWTRMMVEMAAGIHSFWAMVNETDPALGVEFRELLRDMAADDEVWDPHMADVETVIEVDNPEELMED